MMTSIRLAGAQIPVTKDIQYNKKQIFKALDWAKDNQVDHLVTPEGSLSGYGSFDLFGESNELSDALKEVEDHQKESKVFLHLGTCFQDKEDIGVVNRNQIRHYDQKGHLGSITKKQYTVPADINILGHNGEVNIFQLPVEGLNRPYITAGMICNDMWGAVDSKFSGLICEYGSLNQQLKAIDPDLIIHSTNGGKMGNKEISKFSTEGQFQFNSISDTYYFWHEAWLKMTAVKAGAIIVTADSCVSWDFNHETESFNDYTTASPSGIIDSYGNWLEKVPRTGLYYFYYDVDVNAKEKANVMKDYR